MKKILLALSVLFASTAFADTCGKSLTGTFPASQATAICKVTGSAVNHNLVPSADATYDLGSSSKYWQSLYITKIFGNTTNFRIIGGTTATLLNDSTNSNTNVSIADGGAVTISRGEAIFGTALKGVADNIGTLAAAGSTIADGAPVVTTIARVTGANGTTGVVLPALSGLTAGRKITIINSDTVNALKVYGNAAGELIDGQAGNTAVSVAAKLWLECIKYDATNWYCAKTVTPF